MLQNGVILAGGKSSRMGEDKALLPFGEFKTMSEYLYYKLSKQFSNVYISAKDNKFNFNANIIYDIYPQYSPMVAIASILECLKSDFFLISVDMPLLSLKAIKKLIELYNSNRNYDIYLLESKNGIEPTAAIYTTKILPKVKNYLNKDIHKLNYLIKNSNYTSLYWEKNDEFLNLNDKDSYLKAINHSIKIL